MKLASDGKELYGVRFISTNESGVTALGIYSNVSVKSVTSTNSGFASYKAYHDAVLAKGVIPTYGDLGDNVDYFEKTVSYNVIAQGT